MNSGHATNGLVSTIASGSVGGASCWLFEDTDRFEVVNERMKELNEGRRFPDTIGVHEHMYAHGRDGRQENSRFTS